MLRLFAVALGLCGVLACSRSAPKPPPPPPNPPEARAQGCTAYGAPVPVARMPDALPECSGMVASRRHPGVFWAHNDSGHALELFALGEGGQLRARLRLDAPDADDVEAIALVPCGGEDCLVLADIGDNLRMRRQVRLYRVREPEPVPSDAPVRGVEVLPFEYPGGAVNAEALLADPRSGALFVITKRMGGLGEVYRLEGLALGKTGRAELVTRLPATTPHDEAVTGADAHPSGERILLRGFRVWELRRAGASRLEDVFTAPPVQVPDGDLPQPESVAYERDGRGYLLASEGAGTPLWRVRCVDAGSAD